MPRSEPRERPETRRSVRSREEYVALIKGAYHQTLEGIWKMGAYLSEARSDLGYGEYEVMIAEDLPFRPPTARRLVIIAEHPIIGNRAYAHALPAHWGTLYELTKLGREIGNEALLALIEDGTINPEIEHKQVMALRPSQNDEARCVVFRETQNISPDHQWHEDEDADEVQPRTLEVTEVIERKIQGVLGTGYQPPPSKLAEELRQLIRFENRLHPSLRRGIGSRLREMATTAIVLAGRIDEDGKFQLGNIIKALATLIAFKEKWPDATDLVTQLRGPTEDDLSTEQLSLEDLSALPDWIAKLNEACGQHNHEELQEAEELRREQQAERERLERERNEELQRRQERARRRQRQRGRRNGRGHERRAHT